MARSFKRQFQPSISSYFGRIPSDVANPGDTHTVDTAPSTHFPILPATIQSSLLNVGMRVRKSVPEGYQIRMKISRSCGPAASYEDLLPTLEDPSSLPSKSTSAYGGLLPYCGILKVGGLATQPVTVEEDLPPLHFDDEWSLPSSSQVSDASLAMTAIPMPFAGPSQTFKKRRREDADDEDLDLEYQSVSPRSRPISHTPMPNLDQIRPIAQPKSRRKVSMANVIDGGIGESEMIDVEDFGEAPFFHPEDLGEKWT